MVNPAMLQPAKKQESHIVIEPNRSWLRLDLGDLWRYRELLFFLAWRDIKVRYKQTLLGVTWAVIQPLLTMMSISLGFSSNALL